MADARKIDPFDVEGLEKSLNDSATRVSTIWVSYLLFGLYLVIAAGSVTHRQLLLEDPIKLPVLNSDLPLIGFCFLAPVLFVIFHGYVLLQVLLLARTAATYNEAVEKAVTRDHLAPEDNASLRQRLANTLFAQIFAGSTRERDGWLGVVLKGMAWITLAFAPIFILLAFQFAFLPYHSHLATWTHRVLILVELAAFFLIWPLALDAKQNLEWPDVWMRLKRAGKLPRLMLGSKDTRRDEWLWLRQQTGPIAACLLFVILSLSLATFPGEPHVNIFTGQLPWSVKCERWVHEKFDYFDLRFDRLVLQRVDIVDDERLKRIEDTTRAAGEQPYLGERTRRLRGRDLNCGDFSDYADLRRVDLTGAYLRGAMFQNAKLQGASLVGTHLQGAFLIDAQLQGASLDNAQLQGAYLSEAQLQGASLDKAQLQGANLFITQLQGASLSGARLQGAYLLGAQLQGAYLEDTRLQGATLNDTQLQGASLKFARLQGAFLQAAQLQDASLSHTSLQGASLYNADMDRSILSFMWIWRAENAACWKARVFSPLPDAVIDKGEQDDDEPVPATPEKIAKFIKDSVADIPNAERRENVANTMRTRLVVDSAADDTLAIASRWADCYEKTRKIPEDKFDQEHAASLRDLVCNATSNREEIARGIIRNWISNDDSLRDYSTRLARGLLGRDGRECDATRDFGEKTKIHLLSFLPASERMPSTAPLPRAWPIASVPPIPFVVPFSDFSR